MRIEIVLFFFSSRRRHTRFDCDWSSDVCSSDLVTPDTIFQSGSVGKQFTATAVMMLVEEGKVGLEDPIKKYFPDAPEAWNDINVHNLLSHTSGLGEYESGARTKPGGPFYMRLDYTEDE